jgi:hypothetical protein
LFSTTTVIRAVPPFSSHFKKYRPLLTTDRTTSLFNHRSSSLTASRYLFTFPLISCYQHLFSIATTHLQFHRPFSSDQHSLSPTANHVHSSPPVLHPLRTIVTLQRLSSMKPRVFKFSTIFDCHCPSTAATAHFQLPSPVFSLNITTSNVSNASAIRCFPPKFFYHHAASTSHLNCSSRSSTDDRLTAFLSKFCSPLQLFH